MKLFVTNNTKRERYIVTIQDPPMIRPLVCPCIFMDQVQIAFIPLSTLNFAQIICFSQRRTLKEIFGKIGLNNTPIYRSTQGREIQGLRQN